MNQNLIYAAVIGVVVVLAGVLIWNWRPSNNANFPEGLDFVCLNGSCKHEFNMTMKEFGEFQKEHYGERVTCPKCNQQETRRAERCPHCNKLFEQQRGGRPNCPHCKQPLGGPPPA